MKFFTRNWIDGDMTDAEADAVAPAYLRHLDGLDLPEPVRDLAALNPHDGYILDVDHDPAAAILRLRLRCGDLRTGYFDALVNFAGVTIDPAHAAVLAAAKRPAAFEILYDEVDRADAGAFEYRLLLHPTGEAALRFTNVAVRRHPVPDRQTP